MNVITQATSEDNKLAEFIARDEWSSGFQSPKLGAEIEGSVWMVDVDMDYDEGFSSVVWNVSKAGEFISSHLDRRTAELAMLDGVVDELAQQVLAKAEKLGMELPSK